VAEHRRLHAAQLLLAHGADATSWNDFGRTPLHSAVLDDSSPAHGSDYVEDLRLLLEHGADPNAADANLKTPLHLVAGWHYRAASPATVALLLTAGADPNAIDSRLQTPLHRAVSPLPSYLLDRVPSAEIITLLLYAGAEVNATDRQGNTPLHMAAAPEAGWNDPSDVGFIIGLLDGGAGMTAVNEDGDTACDVARQFDGGEVAQDLLCP